MDRVASLTHNHRAWSTASVPSVIHEIWLMRTLLATMVIHCIGGKPITVIVKGNDFVVDNSWVVPYSPLLSKTIKAHCDVEYCISVRSMKYMCKYITKGSDIAAFCLKAPDHNDESMRYQVGRYVSCNEAIWRILSFPIHERYPTLTHLAVHLENGQWVYFTAANAAQHAQNQPATIVIRLHVRYFTQRYRVIKLGMLHSRKEGDVVRGHPDVRSTKALPRPTLFKSLWTVNGVVLPTFRAARQELNLLENDTHSDTTNAEAIVFLFSS